MTGIIIIFYNQPDFLLYQIQCLKKYCKDKHQLIVVDNSSNKEAAEAIRYHASNLRLEYVRVNATSKNSSDSHAFALCFAYQKYVSKFEQILLLDHDNFAVKPFSVTQILNGKLMAGLPQVRNGETYYWPGLLMFKTSVSIDFTITAGKDTGGNTTKAIQLVGEDACTFFNEVHVQNPGFNKSQYNFYALINDGMWMHFVNGSNWAGSADNEERINSLFNLLIETCK